MRCSKCCRCLIECRDEYKYNVEAVELLIRNHLVNMQQYDLHLAQVRVCVCVCPWLLGLVLRFDSWKVGYFIVGVCRFFF